MGSDSETPSLFQILTDYTYDGIQKQILKIKRTHEALNPESEIVVDVKPDPNYVKFDGYSEMKFNVSVYIIHEPKNEP